MPERLGHPSQQPRETPKSVARIKTPSALFPTRALQPAPRPPRSSLAFKGSGPELEKAKADNSDPISQTINRIYLLGACLKGRSLPAEIDSRPVLKAVERI